MINNLYVKYIKEREGAEILSNENGFASYKINEKELFIINMFIDKQKRSTGLFRKMINELSNIALLNKCECLSANIHLWDNGANKTLMSALHLDFKVTRAESGILLIVKDLRGK
ncbi:MAG: hypothetical protein ACXVCP_00390 [Bdellovibrio sp.]